MKNILYKFSLSIAALALISFQQSCSDLDERDLLVDEFTTETYFTNPDAFISAMGVAYTTLYGLCNHGNLWSLQEVSSDEACVPHRGADWEDGGQWLRVHRHEYNAGEGVMNGVWNTMYDGISTCNRLISQFEAVTGENAELAQSFISELKVIRALYHYWLLDIYGNVPIADSFEGADSAPANNTRAEVYNFVLTELTENVPNLSRSVDATTYARMNYYSGQALLANLYINSEVYVDQPRWEEAIAACDEIINSGAYSLENDFFTNFAADNSGSSENIFVIPYDRVNAQGFNLPAMTLHYESQKTFDLAFQPWNGYASLQEFYDSFEEGDSRRNSFITGPQFDQSGDQLIDPTPGASALDDDGPGVVFTPEINELAPRAERQAGARIGKFEYVAGATEHLDNDFPIFRYADILLLKAEALMRMGDANGEALNLVNQLRARAGAAPFTELNNENLLAERGREMCFEAKRRTDLIRFGAYNDPWWEKPASTPDKNIMPLPSAQIGTNPNLTQNPGY